MGQNFFGTLSDLSVRLGLLFSGQEAGQDSFGNRYFRAKPRRGQSRERRFVLYAGKAEASAVPPEWHGWLHHQTDQIPAAENPLRPAWVKPHEPNPSLGPKPIYPPGHQLAGGRRAPATGDYEAWEPGP